MLSPAIRAAADQYAINRGIVPTGGPIFREVVHAFETGHHAGFIARPERVSFRLAGERAFLRLLGAYVAEEITVFHPRSGRYGLLKGLPACSEGQQEPLADVEFYATIEARAEGCGDITEPCSKLLPVLYGFEDLATELVLADGRRVVPAVEVGQLHLSAGGFHMKAMRAEVGDTLAVTYSTNAAIWRCADYEFRLGHLPYYQAQALLQMGFAVGLQPHQYHRRQPGFDYASGAKPGWPTAERDCEIEGCAYLLDEPNPCSTDCPYAPALACAGNCQGCEIGKEVGRG